MPSGTTSIDDIVALAAAKVKKELGHNHFKHGYYADAIESYTQAINLVPSALHNSDRANFFASRAAAHIGLRNYDKAVEDCTESLKLCPTNVNALHRRGLALMTLGSDRLALLDFDAVLRMDLRKPLPSVERTKFEGFRLRLLEKLLGTCIEVATIYSTHPPPDKESRPHPECLPPPPRDTSSLDSLVRLYNSPPTPLRSRLIAARRNWELGTQAYHAYDYVTAARCWSKAMLVDDKLFSYNLERMKDCVEHLPPNAVGHPEFLRAHTCFLSGYRRAALRGYNSILDPKNAERNMGEFTPNQWAAILNYRAMARPAWDLDRCLDLNAAAKFDPYIRALLTHTGSVGEPARLREQQLLRCASELDPEDVHAAMVCYALAEHYYASSRDTGREWFQRGIEADARVQRLWGGVIPHGPVPEDESGLHIRYCAFLHYSIKDTRTSGVDRRLRVKPEGEGGVELVEDNEVDMRETLERKSEADARKELTRNREREMLEFKRTNEQLNVDVGEALTRNKSKETPEPVQSRGEAKVKEMSVINKGKRLLEPIWKRADWENWGRGLAKDKGKGKPKENQEPAKTTEEDISILAMCAADGCMVTDRQLLERGRRMMYCGECERTRYCSTDCQREHWKTHWKTCNVFLNRGKYER
ncbi:hypothetical protein BC937DRAFT_90609 [Endogone sp. FLAS-F59071]|nr:hypothetical protein BC937DRAFT_90609 [Endogone sp. FLAS-F59071]|eukprot:RUS16951.1 hypothetical protein BC937DRAFT_90609 [Endogone sp. FLAS-F59071]